MPFSLSLSFLDLELVAKSRKKYRICIYCALTYYIKSSFTYAIYRVRTVRHTTRIVGNNLTKKNSCQISVELFMPSATILSKLCHHNYINHNAVIIVTAIWRGTSQTAACFNSFLRLAH